jgi:uncharacterized membrane protein
MEKWLTVIVVVLVIIWVSAVIYVSNNQDKCNALGGVYVEGQCFKAELIKITK